ncbi:MAG: S8 family serine peptidase [bacterium]|nr:S8 family serine peptidase [bacterium]
MKSLRSALSHGAGLAAALVALTVCAVDPARSQVAATPKSSYWQGNPHLVKISSHLLRARSLARQGWSVDRIRGRLPVLRFEEELAQIEIRLSELTPEVIDRLEASGVRVTKAYESWARVTGLCDPQWLDRVATLPEVRAVYPRLGAITRSGSVTSQGDASVNVDDARAAWGLTGKGARVGILSDSFAFTSTVLDNGTVSGSGCDAVLTGSNPQDTGDLPLQVRLLDNCDSGPGCADGQTDEGAALAEIVHDLAPGAEILFHTAFRDEADFADGITELVNCGADVIVDDVLYFAEPMFQDGIVAQSLQQAVDGGVAYFSAAGNDGAFGADETFLDVAVPDDEDFPISGDDLHDFGGGDRFGAITVPNGCGIELVLQWNQPFAGMLGSGSASDLDLYFCSSATPGACDEDSALASGTDGQGCDAPGAFGDPFEFLDWTNDTGSPVTGYVAVDHYCGDQSDTRFRIATFALDCSVQSGYTFESGIFDKAQIYGHPAAAAANAVAAAFYGEIDSGGAVEPPGGGQIDVTPSGSLGGNLPFYFDGSGAPLAGAPVDRFKPEMAAPEGVNNTFFGVDIGFDADAFPNFAGTSAAAAHGAAVAALLLELNPVLTPQQTRDALTTSAVDIESPGTDALSGAGLIDAQAAVLAMPTVPLLEVGPAALEFNTLVAGTTSTPQEVTLDNVNLGLNPASEQVQVSAMTLSDSTNFALDVSSGTSPCGSSTPMIGWGSSCTVSVLAQPQAVGIFNADLTVTSDSAVAPSQTVGLSTAGCNQAVIDLTGSPMDNPEVVVACLDITAGPYAIGSGDDVTFRAGRKIVFRDGFSVAAGGDFTAIIG